MRFQWNDWMLPYATDLRQHAKPKALSILPGTMRVQKSRHDESRWENLRHPRFKNVSHKDLVNYMLPTDGKADKGVLVGDSYFRPSATGCGVYCYLKIRILGPRRIQEGVDRLFQIMRWPLKEEDVADSTGLPGRLVSSRLLEMEGTEWRREEDDFGSIDEVIARLVEPWRQNVERLQHHRKWYGLENLQECRKAIEQAGRTDPKTVHHLITWDEEMKKEAGLFLLVWWNKGKVEVDPLTVRPSGFELWTHGEETVDALLNWFKRNGLRTRYEQRTLLARRDKVEKQYLDAEMNRHIIEAPMDEDARLAAVDIEGAPSRKAALEKRRHDAVSPFLTSPTSGSRTKMLTAGATAVYSVMPDAWQSPKTDIIDAGWGSPCQNSPAPKKGGWGRQPAPTWQSAPGPTWPQPVQDWRQQKTPVTGAAGPLSGPSGQAEPATSPPGPSDWRQRPASRGQRSGSATSPAFVSPGGGADKAAYEPARRVLPPLAGQTQPAPIGEATSDAGGGWEATSDAGGAGWENTDELTATGRLRDPTAELSDPTAEHQIAWELSARDLSATGASGTRASKRDGSSTRAAAGPVAAWREMPAAPDPDSTEALMARMQAEKNADDEWASDEEV